MALVYQDTIPLGVGSNDNLDLNQSLWYAVHNPIILRFQRQDFVIASIADDGSGNAKVTLTAPDLTKLGGLIAGDSIYIDAQNALATVLYTGVFSVLDTDNTTYITIGTPFLGNAATQSFINNINLTGYHAEIKLTDENGFTIQTSRWVPLPDGTLAVDISGFLKRLAAIEDDHDYQAINLIQRDIHLSTGVTFYYRERWNAEASVAAFINVPSGEQIFWVNAAKQIGDEYGSNMALYVPFPDTTDWNAKFLTFFDELIFYRGYPLEVALIISDKLIDLYGDNLVYMITQSPGPVEIAEAIDPDDIPGVYRINIDESNLGGSSQYVLIKIVGDGTVFPDQQFHETKKIWIRDCAQNSIYIKWLNTLGGWSYWMFEFDQLKAITVGSAKTFQQTITDLAAADSMLQYLSKRAFPKMTIGTDAVSESNLAGLKGILYSPKVMWLTNPDDWFTKGVADWQTVLVQPGSFNLESTRIGFANVEMVIEFPEINAQTQ